MQKFLNFELNGILEGYESRKVTINTSDLQFLAKGSDHIVYRNLASNGKVVSFKIGKANDLIELYELLQDIYEEIMAEKFPLLNSLRWAKQTFKPLNSQQEFDAFCDQLESKTVLENKNKEKMSEFKINRQIKKVYISSNIFECEDIGTIVEFKPKSVQPDVFSSLMFGKVSEELKISVEKVKEIILNSDPNEKNRWYKKIGVCPSIKGKLNENPLKIFCISPEKELPNFIATKTFKKIQVPIEQEEKLNMRISEKLKQSGLLENLHKIQSVYQSCVERIDMTEIKQVDLKNVHKDQLKKQIEERIDSMIRNLIPLESYYDYLSKFDCFDDMQNVEKMTGTEKICQLFIFLLSLTWKDISLVYRENFRDSEKKESEIWVIDDKLKSLNKIEENNSKDLELFIEYIKGKTKFNVQ